MTTIEQFNQAEVAKLSAKRPIPDFGPGDTLRVNFLVVEGTRERAQLFEGVCIARSSRGSNSSFTVRKISYGEGVERVFPLHSPRIASIEVIRRGAVRRAKLYFLRGRRGKSARIAERVDRQIFGDQASGQTPAAASEAAAEAQGAPAIEKGKPATKREKAEAKAAKKK